jgi:integrase
MRRLSTELVSNPCTPGGAATTLPGSGTLSAPLRPRQEGKRILRHFYGWKSIVLTNFSILAVLCGLRRGEIAALHWRNVNLAAGQLAVVESAEHTRSGVRYKEPKSGRARTVALSATVVAELRAHRLQQAQELLRIGVRGTDDGFVVAKADGNPVHPMTLTQEWRRLVRKSGLAITRLHDLRHAHATHLLASGVHPKVASERLGHSRVGITLDLYSHASQGMQEEAAARVDAALQAALNKRS